MAADPKATIEISAHSRGLAARLREARAKFSKFGGELKKEIFGKDLVKDGFFGRAGAHMVGNLGASAASAAAGFVVDQGRDVLAFNDALKRLEITASKTPEEMARFAKSVRATSDEVGIGASELLKGAQAYVALTGDMDGAAASTRQWGRVAQATNSQVEDISKTAAALKQQMAIKPEDMERAFSALAAQGKAGAIELKDLATQLSSIAPQWGEFRGGKGVQGVKEMGAALQIVKRGFGGDAGETITGLQSLLNALVKHAPQLQKGGVKVFDKDPKTGIKSMRNVLDIMDDLANSKLAKDPTKMEKALGRVEAYRAYLQFKNNREELQRMIVTAGDAGLIQRDLDKYLASTAGRTKVAWQKAKNEIAATFTPERIETFTQLVIAGTKALTAMAGVASTIVGLTEKIGMGLGVVLGYGMSEEERAKIGQAKQLSARYTIAERLLTDRGTAAADPEALREQAVQMVGQEDAMLSRLAGGHRLGYTDTVPAQFEKRMVKGKEENVMTAAERTGYNYAELESLRAQFDKSDLTNKQSFEKVIEELIRKMQANQDQFLQRFGAAVGNPTFKIGGDSVFTATRNAPQNARRPGE